MQLRHKSVLVYYQYQRTGASKFISLRSTNLQAQRQHAYNGAFSPSAKKRLTKAITLLVQCAKKRWLYNEVSKRMTLHHLSFITLTVSDPEKKLSGKEAYQKLLSHFIAWLRRTKKVNTYIWKAELQKNGQIHYHITTPAFINYQEIRDKWNNLQRKAGLLDKYALAKGHYDANSTDIHAVHNINDLSAYLIKYIVKQTQNADDLGGKVWDCSENLSKAKYHSIQMTDAHMHFLQSAEQHSLCKTFHQERFSIVKFFEPPEEYLLTEKEFANYRNYLEVIGNTIIYNDENS
jgi:hypothetical protein